jgi:hypothetical protein
VTDANGNGNSVGTKVVCESCGSQLVVTRGGEGKLHCHEAPMVVVSGATRDMSQRESGDFDGDDVFFA